MHIALSQFGGGFFIAEWNAPEDFKQENYATLHPVPTMSVFPRCPECLEIVHGQWDMNGLFTADEIWSYPDFWTESG